jgi:hypothetical protein
MRHTSPGSTKTELNRSQRPHCRLIFMGNFVMGLAACAKACTPCALSSALLMDGCRGFDFKRSMNPPLKFPRGNWPSQ